MKKILVTGCNGQLGRAINQEYGNEAEFINTDVQAGDGAIALDITKVEDVLALFSQMYDALYDITVIDGKLYVTSGYVGTKLGFELDEDGRGC